MSLPTIHAACDYFGITEEEFFGTRRFSEIVNVRCAVIYVMRKRDEQSFPQIGRRLKRDHSTIISAMKRAELMRVEDKSFAAFVDAQMELPKYSPRAILLESLAREPLLVMVPGPQVLTVAPLPPCPPRLIKLRAAPVPKRFEKIGSGLSSVTVDEDGISLGEHVFRRKLICASRSLLDALRREHPERCLAA